MIYVVLIVQSLIASGTHIVAKIVVNDVEPVALTMIRSSIAAIVLFIIILIRKTDLSFVKKRFKIIIFLSFLAIPVNQFLFLTGIKYSTPANAALLYGTTPAIVLLLSFFRGRETLSLKKTLGVGIAFVGIITVVFERGINFSSEYTLGNLLLFIAVLAWSSYTVFGQPLILDYGAFPISAMTMIVGTLLFLPIGGFGAVNFEYSLLTLPHWGGILYLALGTSLVAYFLWYYALGRIEASKVAIFANLQPVLTTVLSVLLLGQSITQAFVIGGLMALAGVILTQLG